MLLVVVINSRAISSFILCILAFLASCEERLEMGKTLTQAELDYLRTREVAKCISESDPSLNSFEESSNENLKNYAAGKTWKISYSKDSTEIETSYLYVWRVDGSILYLRYKVMEEGSLKNKFIKIDTAANTDMLRNLQEKYCAKNFDSFGLGSSAITIVDNNNSRIFESTDNYVENDYEYKFTSIDPVYYGAINTTRTKNTFKTSTDKTPTKTEKYVYAITTLTTTTTQPTIYTDSTITTRFYCGVNFTTPVLPDTRNDYAFPFTLKCTSSTANQDTATLDINGDGIVDFDPAAEL
jgi:hypothetical protein